MINKFMTKDIGNLNKNQISNIGKIFESNNYGQFEIIGVSVESKKHDTLYVVRFLKTNGMNVSYMSKISRGGVRDYHHRTIGEVGYLGYIFLCNITTSKTYLYPIWKSLILSSKKVCDDWHCFTTFYIECQSVDGWEFAMLDKHCKYLKLKNGECVYGLDTSIWKPTEKKTKKVKPTSKSLWSPEKTLWLKNNFNKYTYQELSNELNKSIGSIKCKASDLALSKKKSIIGDTFKNRYGDVYTVSKIAFRKNNRLYYEVVFENGYIACRPTDDITSGSILSPYSKTLCGVGYIGVVEDGSRHYLYTRWSDMISRCYNKKDTSYHNYGGLGVVVHSRWHCFENYIKDVTHLNSFDEDLVKNKILCLDKDVLKKGNKIYSKNTCMWVTHRENMEEVCLTNNKFNYFEAINILNGLIVYHYNLRFFSRLYKVNRETLRIRLKRGNYKPYKGWVIKYV